jgi:ribonucleotide monophosphatase NagD (HAD superfamily)
MLTLAMEKYGYSKEESVMIGDRVYTDIASGYNAGIDTIFVLSGEGTMDDAKKSDTPPTYIFSGIREVYEKIKEYNKLYLCYFLYSLCTYGIYGRSTYGPHVA